MAYQMVATAVTLKVINRLQTFSNAIRRTFVQHFTRFQLIMCSHGPSALAELLVSCSILLLLVFPVALHPSEGLTVYSSRSRSVNPCPKSFVFWCTRSGRMHNEFIGGSMALHKLFCQQESRNECPGLRPDAAKRRLRTKTFLSAVAAH